MKNKAIYFLSALLIAGVWSCKNKTAKMEEAKTPTGPAVYKGLYSFSPDIKSFKECGHDHEFWVADSSAQLELQYSQLNVKPEEPVYVQVQGKKIKTAKNGVGSGYDSTLVVTKLVKITKDIPKDICN
jgi:copper homeostasis protein (lipoprotein)